MITTLYLKSCALVVFMLSMSGLVIPLLISQKSDIAVVLGFALLLTTPLVSYQAARNIFKQYKKGMTK